MASSFRLGRVFGVDVGVHWSWVFIFFFVTWSFATGVLDEFYPQWSELQRWLSGAVVAAIFFLSVLAHELSHAVVSNRNGLPVRSITLFIFGGVANLSKEPTTPGLEFRIAIVGPLTSLVLGGAFAAAWAALRSWNDGLAGVCANLALINASLAVFNMLPGFPLDGGRVFRSIVWARNKDRLRATRTAARTGEWIAYGIMGVGILTTYLGGIANGVWLLFIGFFLRNASSNSYEQLLIENTLSGVLVSDVMETEITKVPPDLNVEQLVHDFILRHNARSFAVMAAADFAGLITLTDVRKIPRDLWPTTSVYRAMTPLTRLHIIDPTADVGLALRLMSEHDVNQLPVVRGRELVGLLDRGNVVRFIELRRDLGDHAATPPVSPTES